MTRIWLRQFRLIDPSQDLDTIGDVLVEDGLITAVGNLRPVFGAEVVEGRGRWLVPGLVDMHVHLRTPGEEHKETVASGLQAARAGGFTRVGAMANTRPPVDNAEAVLAVERQAAGTGVRLHQYGAATLGLAGREPADYQSYRAAGVRAVSDDGRPIMDAQVMRRVLEEAAQADLLVIVHEEDLALSRGAPLNESRLAEELGVAGQPAAAEASLLARDLALLEAFGGRLHVAHVSSKASVTWLRLAKSLGLPVSAEVTPHHLFLPEEAVRRHGAVAKMNPPLRGREDREALVAALIDGTLEVIATDHAPHTEAEKRQGLEAAPFGIVGLETALALILDRLVRPGLLSPATLVERCSRAPRRLLGLPEARIAVGTEAELTAIDPEATWQVRPDLFESQAKLSPFAGWTLHGRAAGILTDGVWRPCAMC